MKLTTAFVAGILCLACTTLERHGVVGQATSANQLLDTAQSSINGQDKFYVSVEFVVHADQIEQYPLTFKALQDAICEWSIHVPIRVSVYVQEQTPEVGWPFYPEPINYLSKYDVINVLIANLQDVPYEGSPGLVGLWDNYNDKLLLDADKLEGNPTMAYAVALHELGHMFGLPHLVGFDQDGSSGWLVVPAGEDASTYVMYPSVSDNTKQTQLSAVEIALARHHVIHEWTNPMRVHQTDKCELTCRH